MYVHHVRGTSEDQSTGQALMHLPETIYVCMYAFMYIRPRTGWSGFLHISTCKCVYVCACIETVGAINVTALRKGVCACILQCDGHDRMSLDITRAVSTHTHTHTHTHVCTNCVRSYRDVYLYICAHKHLKPQT
jgi:hypothetical protein